jgi:hypothetical protein
MVLVFAASWFVQAAVWHVDSESSSCDDVSGAPFCSLQAAIDAAASGDTILVSNGVYAGEIAVTKSLTIRGSGEDTRIVGAMNTRALFIQPGVELNLSDVTIADGEKDLGAGVFNVGTLYMTGVRVADNVANGAETYTVGRGGGIFNAGYLVIERCAIEGNRAHGDYHSGLAGYGGGIYNEAGATLIVSNSVIAGNIGHGQVNYNGRTGDSGYGGGLCNSGSARLQNCTVASNVAVGGSGGYGSGSSFGGGIYNDGSMMEVIDCTIAGNHSEGGENISNETPGRGGGIYTLDKPTTIQNTIIADNTSRTSGPDCHGWLNSLGYVMVEDLADCAITNDVSTLYIGYDPILAPLGNYGGPTKTCALRVNSPALDRGQAATALDQRGSGRPMDLTEFSNIADASDIGAYEFDNDDDDSDGIYNDWEVQYGLDPDSAADAAQHSDSDGLTNLEEFQHITDPLDADTDDDGIDDDEEVVPGIDGFVTSPILADSDSDGMRDDWEVDNDLNPTNAVDAAEDADEDCMSNLEEFLNGSDPNDADTDDDSLADGWEFANGHSLTNVYGGLFGEYFELCTAFKRPGWGTYDGVYDIEKRGSLCYLAAETNGLQIVDVSVPTNPVAVGEYILTNSASGIAVVSNYAYVVNISDGLLVFDVSDPANPSLVTTLAMPSGGRHIEAQHPIVYVITWKEGLQLVDISDPAHPAIVANYCIKRDSSIYSYIQDVCLRGNLAYVCGNDYTTNDYGLRILDVSTPSTPIEVGKYDTDNNVSSVYELDGYAYLVYSSDLQMFDVSEPTNPVWLASGEASSYDHITSQSNQLFVTGSFGWQISEIDAVSGPYPVAATNAYDIGLSHGTQASVVEGPYIFTAHYNDGLIVLRHAPYDEDQNGLEDRWEITHFGAIGQDAFGDEDADGISNWGEFLCSLNPTNGDEDADGIADGWETDYALDSGADDGAGDADGDGASNWREFIADTNPRSGTSRFELRILEDTMLDQHELIVDSSPNRHYKIQYATESPTGTWHDLTVETPGTGGELSVTRPNVDQQIYYRARVIKR